MRRFQGAPGSGPEGEYGAYWDREHALDLRGTRWFFVSSVAEEGSDGRQRKISTSGRDTAILFHRSLRMLAEKLACSDVQTSLRELQKQAESVPIGTDSVGTRLSLIHESLGEKTFEQEGERRSRFHIRFSQCSSSRFTAKPISSGQALKYQ
jgi:hypothetical protein